MSLDVVDDAELLPLDGSVSEFVGFKAKIKFNKTERGLHVCCKLCRNDKMLQEY